MAEAEYWRFTVARDCQKKNTSETHSECRLQAKIEMVVSLFGKGWSPSDLADQVSDMSQLASITRSELTEGKVRGNEHVQISLADGFALSLLPGRSLDIGAAHWRGVPLASLAPPGAANPAFVSEEDGFARTFQAGLLFTCGLTNIGGPVPAADAADADGGPVPTHGRISAVPAGNVSTSAQWEGDKYVLRVRAVMRETAAFGTNLQLTRVITAVLGENSFRVEDEVENLSRSRESPLMFAYHCNPGFPVLSPQSRLDLHSARTVDRLDPTRAVGREVYSSFAPPGSHEETALVDRVWFHEPVAADDGTVTLLIHHGTGEGEGDPDRAFGLFFRYPYEEMTQLTTWSHMVRGEYICGLEPGNANMRGRTWHQDQGLLETLPPGGKRRFSIEIGVVQGAALVGMLAELGHGAMAGAGPSVKVVGVAAKL